MDGNDKIYPCFDIKTGFILSLENIKLKSKRVGIITITSEPFILRASGVCFINKIKQLDILRCRAVFYVNFVSIPDLQLKKIFL